MLIININNNRTIQYKQERNKIFIKEYNGDSYDITNELMWDIIEIRNNVFHIIKNNCSYNAEVIEADLEQKQFVIKVSGIKHNIKVQDKLDLLLEKLGMNKSAVSNINVIKAPMPGLILDVKVKKGDKVKKDDTLIILEAMKMENIIKSPGDCVIKSVRVGKGDGIEKGELLVEFV